MNRSISSNAIILSLKPLGDNNYSVTLLTKDKGIIYATLYGGPKSKLRSLVSQWHSGIIYLYDNQEKNQIKINDFDVKNFHSTFSQSLYKAFAANLVAEIVIKTKCGGSYEECYEMTLGFFDGMELCDEEQSKVGLIRFLWRYLRLLGIQAETSICGKCGNSITINEKENYLNFRENIYYYNSIENYFLCADCSNYIKSSFQNKKNTLFQLRESAIYYLHGINTLPPSQVRKLQITRDDYEEIKNIIFFLIGNNIDCKLNSLESGIGIL